MSTAVIYARYSTDLQREASIEDQIRLCEAKAKAEGLQVTERYSDHGISGASLMRPGIQALLRDARDGRFDTVIAEALDRLSRDLSDVANLHKQLTFAGVRLLTVRASCASGRAGPMKSPPQSMAVLLIAVPPTNR